MMSTTFCNLEKKRIQRTFSKIPKNILELSNSIADDISDTLEKPSQEIQMQVQIFCAGFVDELRTYELELSKSDNSEIEIFKLLQEKYLHLKSDLSHKLDNLGPNINDSQITEACSEYFKKIKLEYNTKLYSKIEQCINKNTDTYQKFFLSFIQHNKHNTFTRNFFSEQLKKIYKQDTDNFRLSFNGMTSSHFTQRNPYVIWEDTLEPLYDKIQEVLQNGKKQDFYEMIIAFTIQTSFNNINEHQDKNSIKQEIKKNIQTYIFSLPIQWFSKQEQDELRASDLKNIIEERFQEAYKDHIEKAYPIEIEAINHLPEVDLLSLYLDNCDCYDSLQKEKEYFWEDYNVLIPSEIKQLEKYEKNIESIITGDKNNTTIAKRLGQLHLIHLLETCYYDDVEKTRYNINNAYKDILFFQEKIVCFIEYFWNDNPFIIKAASDSKVIKQTIATYFGKTLTPENI